MPKRNSESAAQRSQQNALGQKLPDDAQSQRPRSAALPFPASASWLAPAIWAAGKPAACTGETSGDFADLCLDRVPGRTDLVWGPACIASVLEYALGYSQQ